MSWVHIAEVYLEVITTFYIYWKHIIFCVLQDSIFSGSQVNENRKAAVKKSSCPKLHVDSVGFFCIRGKQEVSHPLLIFFYISAVSFVFPSLTKKSFHDPLPPPRSPTSRKTDGSSLIYWVAKILSIKM